MADGEVTYVPGSEVVQILAVFVWAPKAITISVTEDARVIVTRGTDEAVVMFPVDPMSVFRALVGHVTLHQGLEERGRAIMDEQPRERTAA